MRGRAGSCDLADLTTFDIGGGTNEISQFSFHQNARHERDGRVRKVSGITGAWGNHYQRLASKPVAFSQSDLGSHE